ncbi:amidase signature enzyme [Xylaria sp. FL0933]|nr:amidase signature enzyme [Xylaria sp. FL0933]
MANTEFDCLRATAADLLHLLGTGKLSSVHLVEQCLAQIERHEPTLNALVSIAPRSVVLRIANELDEERRGGRVRSPLHGIPVILKDCFITASSLGMKTCAGAVVFADAKANKNAAIVQKLINAGLIIIAKGNMTELAGMKTLTMMPGWSAYGGQTISPYVGKIKENERLLGHSAPGGSSTGPAVSVAAGFAPLAVGAETIGSIITPSVRMALYALKPTAGAQDTGGTYRLSEFYDAPGPLAKCAADLASMTGIMLGRSLHSLPGWSGLSLGFVDPVKWGLAEEMCEQLEGTVEQMTGEYEAAISKIRLETSNVKYPVEVADVSELVVNGADVVIPIAYWDFRNITIPEFIQCFDDCCVTSLDDIINFNEKNSSVAMPDHIAYHKPTSLSYPNQDQLIKANTYTQPPNEIADLKRRLRQHARDLLDKTFEVAQVNLIVAPGDSPLCVHAAAAGYPIVAVPLGQLNYNSRPFGLCALAKADREDLLLQFAAAFEKLLPARAIPTL